MRLRRLYTAGQLVTLIATGRRVRILDVREIGLRVVLYRIEEPECGERWVADRDVEALEPSAQ